MAYKIRNMNKSRHIKESKHKQKTILLIHIICPIVIGVFVYSMLSPDVIFIRKLIDFSGRTICKPVLHTDNVFLRFIRNYIPDMLWGYSLVFTLFYIAGNNVANVRKIFYIAFSFSVVIEMMQKTSFVSGTFDVLDILAEFVAEITAACIIYKLCLREEL